jgi:hypothetical protein
MDRGRLTLGFALAFALVPALSSAAPTGAGAIQVAYVDPGAGSYILQTLVAMLAGAVVAIHIYWAKIKKLFGFSGTHADDDKRGDRPDDD